MTNKDNKTYEGSPCKRKGHTLRYVTNRVCIECMREDNKKYSKTEKSRATAMKYRAENIDEYREYQREYHKKWARLNKDKVSKYNKAQYEKNKNKENKENK